MNKKNFFFLLKIKNIHFPLFYFYIQLKLFIIIFTKIKFYFFLNNCLEIKLYI
jgi:hypothetical protein